MIIAGAVIVMGITFRKIHGLEWHMMPIAAILAALLGASAGSLIALVMWSGERLGVWTVPQSPQALPPIRWLKMLKIALLAFAILVAVAAWIGI